MTLKEFLTEIASDCAADANVAVIPLDPSLQARIEFVEYADAPGGTDSLILIARPKEPEARF